jgi:hypothetical protein
MEMTELCEKCSFILIRETELMKQIASLQSEVWNAVINRVWTDFEAQIRAINTLSAEFDALESEREALLPAFYHDNNRFDAGFYALVAEFPDELRNKLTEVFRELKMETIRVRISNDNLLSYLTEMKATITGFLEMAFPDRMGRLYSRQGTQIPQDMRSMVLNQHY